MEQPVQETWTAEEIAEQWVAETEARGEKFVLPTGACVSPRAAYRWGIVTIALESSIERDRPNAYGLAAVVPEVARALACGCTADEIGALFNAYGGNFVGTPVWSVLNACARLARSGANVEFA